MIRVQTHDFDIGQEIDALTAGDSSIGAVVTFTGLVRDMASDASVAAMTLEHYPGMTERELEAIEREALQRFDIGGVSIVHRVGRLTAGERIVLVVTTSAHRGAAFEAAQFLMDYLKTRAPFWKREETHEGARWVEARTADDAAAARWKTD